MKVLIADDSALIRERLMTMISELNGIEIISEARDGQEALDIIQKLHHDVVILDIKMPKGNGIDVLKYIDKNKPSCMVIMLTNYPYPQYREACMEAGADFFFDKSTEFTKVPKVLKWLISGEPYDNTDRSVPVV